jgi:hypothetical protein
MLLSGRGPWGGGWEETPGPTILKGRGCFGIQAPRFIEAGTLPRILLRMLLLLKLQPVKVDMLVVTRRARVVAGGLQL